MQSLNSLKALTVQKLENQLTELRAAIHRETIPIGGFRWFEGECPGAREADFDDSSWPPFELGDSWGGYDKTAWFRATVEIPRRLLGERLALRFLVGPRDGGGSTAETMLYVNGFPLQAIDIWHEEAWLPPETVADGEIVVALKAWSGVLKVPERRRFKVAELIRIDSATESLYYLADTIRKALAELDSRDWRHVRMLEALDETFERLDWSRPGSESFYCSVGEALEYLRAESNAWQTLEREKPTVTGVGHAHIDMAWLWRLSHSREKAARTFATALHLMRQYPEYRFMHSSPQLYKYLEEDHPEIFAQVKSRIESGEWEITGGMWIESDINLPSGESLIRQILFGKRYIREKFGRDTRVVWLPDVFGYTPSLPQILLGSGIDYFMTTKISWSQFNRFPHDTFNWRGIDGSEILTHFITTPEEGSKAYTYNGQLEPRDVAGLWENYQQKPLNDELLQAYGWGDGGGGPTKEMLEAARAMCNLPGLPKVELGHVEPYFERLGKRLAGETLPVWDGELYLEYHRGTYTSQARTKRNNRLAEGIYHRAELTASIAGLLCAAPYPDLREGWERLLLNQFHDILPGSSIREVYEDSERDFEFIHSLGREALAEARSSLLDGLSAESGNSNTGALRNGTGEGGAVVFNSTSFALPGLVALPYGEDMAGMSLAGDDGEPLPSQRVNGDGGEQLLVQVPEVPPLGYRSFGLVATSKQGAGRMGDVDARDRASPITISEREIETPFYRIKLNEKGQITSLLDRRANRQLLAKGRRANVLQAFEDKPLKFDAWDIDLYYQQKMREVDELVSATVEESGPLRGVLRLEWRFLGSTISQRLVVYAHDPRIDFVSEVDWQEKQVLLKAAFPTGVRSTRATFDIQFGSVERPTHWNTSWDWARFEVVGHKWADLSEGNYGVALLNDCKYGHDVKDDVMRLTLIKSPIEPDPLADLGRHEFTYALLPHGGTWQEGGVLEQGYALNSPLEAVRVAGDGQARSVANQNGSPIAVPSASGGPVTSAQNVAREPGQVPARFSFAAVDSPNVVVETVKRAEDGDGWIVRLYEAKQFSCPDVKLSFGLPLERAVECNMIEEGERAVKVLGRELAFAIAPFEVKTFRVWFA